MSNFLRVVRYSLRYRFTFVGAVVCALAVGVLWGGNIGAVFPFVEVVFRGQSLQEWVDTEIVKAEDNLGEIDEQCFLSSISGRQNAIICEELFPAWSAAQGARPALK